MKQKINTFIIGAQKAGTTSIYDWLGQHPEIEAPQEIKDYHFFNFEERFDKGYSHIDSFYKENVRIKIHGAVNYLYFDELCAMRIHEYNPNAKIIICLRNPIDRAFSAYKYFVRVLQEQSKSFSEALGKELNNELKSFFELSNNTYIEHGYYYNQIKTYLRYFEKEQIKIVFFEEISDKEKQADVMRSISEFLEIDKNFLFNFIHLNASGMPKSNLLNYIKRKTFLPKIIKLFIPFAYRRRIAKQIEQLNISNKNIEIEITQKDKDILSEKFKDSNNKMKMIIQSDIINSW